MCLVISYDDGVRIFGEYCEEYKRDRDNAYVIQPYVTTIVFGPMGVGKTTYLNSLDTPVLPEPINDFKHLLPDVYNGVEGALERLQKAIRKSTQQAYDAIAFSGIKSLHMEGEIELKNIAFDYAHGIEFDLEKALKNYIRDHQFEKIVYHFMDAPTDVLLSRIAKRGRDGEHVTAEFIDRLRYAYQKFNDLVNP